MIITTRRTAVQPGVKRRMDVLYDSTSIFFMRQTPLSVRYHAGYYGLFRYFDDPSVGYLLGHPKVSAS